MCVTVGPFNVRAIAVLMASYHTIGRLTYILKSCCLSIVLLYYVSHSGSAVRGLYFGVGCGC